MDPRLQAMLLLQPREGFRHRLEAVYFHIGGQGLNKACIIPDVSANIEHNHPILDVIPQESVLPISAWITEIVPRHPIEEDSQPSLFQGPRTWTIS